MTTTELLEERAGLLAFAARALGAGSEGVGHSLAVALMAAGDEDLLLFHTQAVEVLRLAEAAVTTAAGEVARRSDPALPDPLARRMGEKSPAALLAARSGQHESDAAPQAALGASIAPRAGVTGEILPAFHERLAGAVADGRIDARGARAIERALTKIEPHATLDELADAERALVDGAADWSAKTLQDVCRVLPDRFDPDGLEPREAELRAGRGARRKVLDDGTVRWVIDLDPESAAYLDAAIDARTAPRRQVAFDAADAGAGAAGETETGGDGNRGDQSPSVFDLRLDPDLELRLDGERADMPPDGRTLAQKRLDAFVDIARDSLRHDDGEVGGVDTTAVIHIPVELLTTGTGSAWFEGVETPVGAATARRMAAFAELVALVVDGDEQPLRLGTTKRFFTRGQRRAMSGRDRGCVWPDCPAPPRWCEAAHVAPWAGDPRGPTDIENGALLCHFHHRRLDEDGWELERRDGVWWFRPPTHIDSTRRPRRSGPVLVDRLI